MVEVKQAVALAQKYLPEVFDSAAGKEMLLEGVEISEDDKFWNVTLSYPSGMRRTFKTVKLYRTNGDFVGARSEQM